LSGALKRVQQRCGILGVGTDEREGCERVIGFECVNRCVMQTEAASREAEQQKVGQGCPARLMEGSQRSARRVDELPTRSAGRVDAAGPGPRYPT